MSINLSALMKQRYDTAANWTAQNPTLLAGEIGIESDTKKWKVGTGSTAWTSLVYAIGGTYPIVNADIAAGAAIVDTKLATIATAGKVSNSATTAASANTASAIVARDASGNFTAGTITAALTGAASSNVLKAGDTMTGVLAVTAGTAALPGIAVSGDTNTGIYSPGADQLAIATGGTGRITVDASGNVNIDSNTLYVDAVNNRAGIGTSAPAVPLHVVGDARFQASSANASFILIKSDRATSTTVNQGIISFQDSSTNILAAVACATQAGNAQGNLHVYTANTSDNGNPLLSSFTFSKEGRLGIGTTSPSGTVDIKAAASTAPLIIQGPSSEFARLDSSGRLLVGTSSAYSDYIGADSGFTGIGGFVCNIGDGVAQFQNWSSSAALDTVGGTTVFISRCKSGTVGTHTSGALASGNPIGRIVFNTSDGTNFRSSAYITAEVDGSVSTGDVPGRLVFSTTADGAASPTARFRISSDGSFSSVIPGGSTIYPHFAARAWVNFNGTGTVAIRGSGNVSSITDNAVGYYTVNLTTAMPDINYSITGSCASNGTSVLGTIIANTNTSAGTVAPTTSAFTLIVSNFSTSIFDSAYVNVAVFR